MEKEKSTKTMTKKSSDFNGNNADITKNGIKDKIATSDGRVLYPCQYCNKVFPIKKSRTLHIKKCPAKDYILTVGERKNIPQKPEKKIAIQQNIVLSQQMDVSKILKSDAPPIKITIRRTGPHDAREFTVTNSLVLKEKNEAAEDFIAIAKRLQSNSVTLFKQPKDNGHNPEVKPMQKGNEENPEQQLTQKAVPLIKQPIKDSEENPQLKPTKDNDEKSEQKPTQEDNEQQKPTQLPTTTETKTTPVALDPESECSSSDDSNDESNETTCRECGKEFKTPIELLRHSRKCHSYPKVVMALSEVKKFYSVQDRSECPICHKPFKTSFRSAFVKHLHTHTNEMRYSCHVCNKKFRRADHMKAHKKRHIVKNKK